MATQYTSILKLALPTEGELSGTWGDVVNDNITSMVEEAIAGRAVIDSWTANGHTLTTADGTTAEARCAMLEFTDTNTDLTGNAEVICPTASKIYIAKNATGAGYSVTLKTSAGTGIAVPDGETMFLFCDGTNVVEAVTSVKTLKIADGVQVNTILDEDDMTSDSATALATQQSIKAYVDAQVTAQDLDIAGDSGTGAVDLDSESLTVAGTTDEIETSASGQTITVGLPSAVVVTTSLTTPTVQATNINANDGSTSATIADSTGVMTIASSVLTTTDINGGTVDGVTIGGASAGAGTFTTATTTTSVVTDTISERTATSGVTIDSVVLKDGGITATGGGSLTGTWADLGTVTTVDINGGSVDGATLGTNSAITEAQIDNINIDGNAITSTDTNGDITISPNGTGTVVIDTDLDVDNININGNTISSTDTNGNIALTPDGTGEVDISKVDIDSGAIDGTTIGGSTPAAGSFTGLTLTGDATFGDDDKAIFGAGSDLQIYHDGSNSIIEDTGTGVLELKTNGTHVYINGTSETLAKFEDDGAVSLYYDDAIKLATTATGIDVTGTVTADLAVIGGSTNNVGIFGSSGPNAGIIGSTANQQLNIYGNGTGPIVFQTGGAYLNGLSVLGTERMRITSSGNVGIGTSSPAQKLTVASEGRLRLYRSDNTRYADLYNDNNFLNITTSNDPIKIDGQSYVRFDVNNTEKMRIDSSGNVGIGTSSPAYKLQVNGTTDILNVTGSTGNAFVRFTDSDASSDFSIGADDGSGAGAGSFILYDRNNTAYRLVVDSSGNVGIGTSSPENVSAVPDLTVAGKFFTSDGTSANPAQSFISDQNTGMFRAGADTLAFTTGGSEAARITSGGSLLVGATTNLNSSNFQVSAGSGASATPYAAIFNTASSPTSSASTRLDLGFLSGSSNYVATNTTLGTINFMGQGNDAGYGGAAIKAIVTSGGNATRTNHSVDMVFSTMSSGSTGATERMRIDSSGNVGIDVTPSDWGSDFKALEVGQAGSGISTYTPNRNFICTSGAYHDESGYKYAGSNYATAYQMRASDGTYIWSTAPSGTDGDPVTFTQRMVLDNSGNLDLTNGGGNIIMANGAGIDFSATANGSGTTSSELLDDYEEGTFNIGLTFGGNNTGLTLARDDGVYTKVGRIVTVNLHLDITSNGSSSGAVKITGLPFVVSDILPGTAVEAGSAFTFFGGVGNSVSGFTISADDGTTQADVYTLPASGTTMSNATESDFADSSNFRISLTYFTTS